MRRERLDVRPGEVDIEEKEEDPKTGYGWLLRERQRGEEVSEGAERGGRKGENAYIKFVVVAAKPVEEKMSVDLADSKGG